MHQARSNHWNKGATHATEHHDRRHVAWIALCWHSLATLTSLSITTTTTASSGHHHRATSTKQLTNQWTAPSKFQLNTQTSISSVFALFCCCFFLVLCCVVVDAAADAFVMLIVVLVVAVVACTKTIRYTRQMALKIQMTACANNFCFLCCWFFVVVCCSLLVACLFFFFCTFAEAKLLRAALLFSCLAFWLVSIICCLHMNGFVCACMCLYWMCIYS